MERCSISPLLFSLLLIALSSLYAVAASSSPTTSTCVAESFDEKVAQTERKIDNITATIDAHRRRAEGDIDRVQADILDIVSSVEREMDVNVNTSIASIEQMNASLSSDLHQYRAEVGEMNRRLIEADSSMRTELDRLSSSINSTHALLDNTTKKVEEALSTANATLTSVRDDSTSVIESLNTEVEKVNDTMSDVQSRLTALRDAEERIDAVLARSYAFDVQVDVVNCSDKVSRNVYNASSDGGGGGGMGYCLICTSGEYANVRCVSTATGEVHPISACMQHKVRLPAVVRPLYLQSKNDSMMVFSMRMRNQTGGGGEGKARYNVQQCCVDVEGYFDCVCEEGYFGSMCEKECPFTTLSNGSHSVCSGRGVCLNGIGESGECQCDTNVVGLACSACDQHYYGERCDRQCPSVDGYVCAGRGTCSEGVEGIGCVCEEGNIGEDCSIDCPKTSGGEVCGGTGACSYDSVIDTAVCTCSHSYEWGGECLSNHTLRQIILPPDPSISNAFGNTAVHATKNGSRLFVGCAVCDVGNTDSGVVYVYDFNYDDHTYNLSSLLLPPLPVTNLYFGHTIALSHGGSLVFVGDVLDEEAANNAGACFVFAVNSSGGYEMKQKIVPDPSYAGQEFTNAGVVTTSDGGILALSAMGVNVTYSTAGAVYIYHRRADVVEVEYEKTEIITPPTPINAALFGSSNSISMAEDGSKLIVGEYGQSHLYAYLYNATSRTYGVPIQVFSVTGYGASTKLGMASAMSGDGGVIFVGAPDGEVDGTGSGVVFVYAWNGTAGEHGGYSQVGVMSPSDGTSGQQFGREHIVTNEDGTLVVVASAYDASGGQSNSGSAYKFAYNTQTKAWVEVKKFIPDVTGYEVNAMFGQGLALAEGGRRMFISHPRSDYSGTSDAGVVLSFTAGEE